MTNKIKLKQLQRATLTCQGLHKKQAFGKGKKAVLSAIERLGYVQIDSISVIERAHHHTLWTRIPDYKSEHLDQLVDERKIFEYWFHAASYLPISAFRHALPRMQYFKRDESPHYKGVDPKLLSYILDKIRIDGPQKARDFQSPNTKSGTWWNWKPAKVALEKLFFQGDLMISGRDGIEKMYDLTERVLPSSVDTSEPSSWEHAAYLVKTYLAAYGVTTFKQITHLKRGKEIRQHVEQVLQQMLEEKTVQLVDIEGMPSLYVLSDLLDNTIKKPASNIRLLSPFDNAIIHRDRLEHLFGYAYRLESYVPKEKREYGYFCLPILFGDEFIGCVDCKTHRKKGEFELIHLHIKNTNVDTDKWLEPFMQTVERLADFNQCKTVKLTQVSMDTDEPLLKKAFQKKS